MTNRRPEPQHEWWKDNSDQLSQRAFLESYRQAQRDEASVAWRRVLSLVAAAACFAYVAASWTHLI